MKGEEVTLTREYRNSMVVSFWSLFLAFFFLYVSYTGAEVAGHPQNANRYRQKLSPKKSLFLAKEPVKQQLSNTANTPA